MHDYLGLYHDISAAKVLSQSELSTWNTVLEPLFYTFMFLVLDFCILMYWGHEEDKKDSSFTPEQKK